MAGAVQDPERQVADRDLVAVRYRSTWELAEELVAYRPAVVVLTPAPLRDAVLELLRTASRLDVGGSDG